MSKQVRIIIGVTVAVITLLLLLAIYFSTRNAVPTRNIKSVGITKIETLIAYKNGALYYTKGGKLYKLEGKKETPLSGVVTYAGMADDEYLNYSESITDPNTNTTKKMSYLVDLNNGQVTSFQNTLSVIICQNDKYFLKPSAYYADDLADIAGSLVDSKGKVILQADIYGKIFCLADKLFYTVKNFSAQDSLYYTDLKNPVQKKEVAFSNGSPKSIFNSRQNFYHADIAKISNYDDRLQKTETSAFGIDTALVDFPGQAIYYVQPPVKLNARADDAYSNTTLMKFDTGTKKVAPVAILDLDNEILGGVKTDSAVKNPFGQVIYNDKGKIYYLLLQGDLYEVKK